MKKFFKRLIIALIFIFGLIWIYACSLIGVNKKVKLHFSNLKIEILKQGYQTNFYVISGRRWQLDNYLLNKFGGAASKSKHKDGDAIDLIIFDVNNDGKSDAQDVNIVYKILDIKIIGNKGGVGTYKNENDFLNQQMIHFDSRGSKARWHR
ncbi:MAG: hypothetical protein AB8F94_04135 [Saprospiraceae bacterium]